MANVFFFWKVQHVLHKWNFFRVCQILFNLACMSWKKPFSCVFLSSLLITYLINSCFLQKSLDEVLSFGSKSVRTLYAGYRHEKVSGIVWTPLRSDSPFIGIGAARRSFASLPKSSRNHRSYLWTEALSDRAIFVWPWKMVSVSVRYLFHQPMDEKIKT